MALYTIGLEKLNAGRKPGEPPAGFASKLALGSGCGALAALFGVPADVVMVSGLLIAARGALGKRMSSILQSTYSQVDSTGSNES